MTEIDQPPKPNEKLSQGLGPALNRFLEAVCPIATIAIKQGRPAGESGTQSLAVKMAAHETDVAVLYAEIDLVARFGILAYEIFGGNPMEFLGTNLVYNLAVEAGKNAADVVAYTCRDVSARMEAIKRTKRAVKMSTKPAKGK